MSSVKSQHRKDIADGLTREIAAEFAVHALFNSRRLLQSARLLEANADYGSGLALATTAGEEVGKFLIAAGFLLGGSSPEHVLAVGQQHLPKQALGFTAGAIAKDLLAAMRSAPITLSADSQEAAIDSLLAWIPRLSDALTPSLPSLELGASAALQAEHELTRQSALYVSLALSDARVKVTSPSDVTAAVCRQAIDSVAPFIDSIGEPSEHLIIEGSVAALDEVSLDDFAAFLLQLLTPENGKVILQTRHPTRLIADGRE